MGLTTDSAAPPGDTEASPASPPPPGPEDPASLKVVPVRHYARWVAAVAVVVLVAQFAHGLFTNPVWEWGVFRDYVLSETIVQAVGVTLQLTAYAAVFGFLLGTVLAFMRLSQSPVLQTVAWTYIWIFRSIPLIVQLLFWFNLGAPVQDVGVRHPVRAGVLSRSTRCTWSARSAPRSSDWRCTRPRTPPRSSAPASSRSTRASWRPPPRWASRGCGSSGGSCSRRPCGRSCPTAANELIGLFKGTSVVYVMAIGELFYQVQVIYGRNGRVIPLLLVATAWYVVLTTAAVGRPVLRRAPLRPGRRRTLPPTPLQRGRRFVRDLRAAAAQRGGPVVP